MPGAQSPCRIFWISALTSRALLEAKRTSSVHHVADEYYGDLYEQARHTKVMDITAQALVFRHEDDDAKLALSYVGASSRGFGVSADSWWGRGNSATDSVRDNIWAEGGSTPSLRRMSNLMRRQLQPTETSFSFSFEDEQSSALFGETSGRPTPKPTLVAKSFLPTIVPTPQLPTLHPTLLPTSLPSPIPMQVATPGRPTRVPSTANVEPTIGTSTPDVITVTPTLLEVTQEVFLLSSILVDDISSTFFNNERTGQ